ILSIRAAANECNDLNTAKFYNLLGLLQLEKSDLESAIWSFRRAIEVHESLRVEDKDLCVFLYNLTIALSRHDDLDEAESTARRSLVIREKTLGADDPALADGTKLVAEILWRRNKFAEAEPFVRRTIEIQEKAFGSEDV